MTDFHMTNLAERYATESELKAALRDREFVVIEWESANLTFYKSPNNLVIVRAGAMGGDTFELHGGWKYTFPWAMEKEWQEIVSVVPAYAKQKRILT